MIVVAGGHGFIGQAAVRATGGAARGRGESLRDATVLVWAAGARRATVDDNRAEHVTAALAALDAPGLRRVVYLSSGEIYGAQAVPFREDAPRLGGSPYARAKIEAEDAIATACAARAIACVILRPAVVYGPGQRGSMLVPSLIAALRAGTRFAMTRGEQTRDYVFVDDVAAAIARACADDAPAGVYNVGTGVETMIIDVARRLARRLGRDDLLDVGAIAYRDGEQMAYALDPARARGVLGWRAQVELDDGLARTLAG